MMLAGIPVRQRMIEPTYGHLVRGSEQAARTRLDGFTTRAAEVWAEAE